MAPPLKRVLYVDDEEMLRTVTKLALSRVGGLEVALCDSGVKAVEAAKAFAPDLVLLDVMMPEMDGPATLHALRADPDTAALPVIFLTAKTHPREIDAFKALGALDVIGKPFEPMGLAQTLQDIWAGYRGEA
jgi:CheY-like chemotaxis protein